MPTPLPAALVARAAAGDAQAFGQLVLHHQHGVFGFLWRMGLRRAVAEDLAQETFLRAWAALPRYDARRASLATWLLAIARHLALNELDSARHRIERPAAADDAEPPACESTQPAEALQRQRERARLHHALTRLPPAQRSVLALAYLRELSLAEVATIEGITEGAAKLRLHRARAALRLALETLP